MKPLSSSAVSQDRLRRLRTIFLDRDGVLNEKMPEGKYVTRWEEFRLLPGVAESIRRLNHAGLRVILVSNQRGIALGLYTSSDVEAIHARLRILLEAHHAQLDGIYYCPHEKGQCDCRKPLRGLFEQAVRDSPDIDASSSMMIGDSLSDIEFGRRLGMTCIFLEGNPALRKSGAETAQRLADWTCTSLPEAVAFLLAERGAGT